jgi:hypothetical protein
VGNLLCFGLSLEVIRWMPINMVARDVISNELGSDHELLKGSLDITILVESVRMR